ncbi:MAG: 16S rRNA (uracil(1498)-N(3))-methyltransferase [Nitrospirota bacterium]
MRIFIAPEHIQRQHDIKVPADKAHYIISVLRSRVGDPIEIIDGRGKAFEAIITGITRRDVVVDLRRELPANAESPAYLVLCQGMLKGEKMDLVVQKATELGTKEIIPLITERCIVRATRKVQRWSTIAEEAAEQCGRAFIPIVHEPEELNSWLMAHSSSQLKGFIFWEEGGVPLREAFQKVSDYLILPSTHSPIHLIIGPEGGLTAAEIKSAEARGLIRTSLGSRTLRAETAAIVSMALVQFLVENREKLPVTNGQ